jgi:two-component system CheB/CheR fusion protein
VTPPATFPIVGIGASAGGIEALDGFFRGLPDNPGLGFVIVTHLSSERESLLHQVVARHTPLPVQVAADGMPVEPDHVYVLPGDAILGIEKGHLLIRKPDTAKRERKPIDIFFSALAVDQGELAAGVVLSGGDGDGTLGIKAIKEHGGLTLAQLGDGYGPQHPDMPNSAIATGLVDLALPVEAMGARLAALARGLDVFNHIAAESGQRCMQEIYALLRSQVGHDFSGYKTKTFLRRVHRRMQVRQVDTVEGYIEQLRQDRQEVTALFRDLLINVTSFFRDVDAFDTLAELVVPKLFEKRDADDTVRVWVPGCATGEEVFSIAMLLRERMDHLSAVPRVQIFATDIDERALAVARAGRYPAALLDSVPPERRQRFFFPDGGSCVVAREVRDLCIFSPHSVMRDPPFSRIDLISCRNLLIYFGPDIQDQVIPTFHYALRPDGFLFLGTSETIGRFSDLFTPIDRKHRVFQRRSDGESGIRPPMMVSNFKLDTATEFAGRRAGIGGTALRQAAESQVLERFAPPYVIVNRDGDVSHYSARTGKYLEAAPGVPTRQLLTLARKGLRHDLRTAFREAVETGRTVTRRDVAIEGDDGRVQVITLTIDPLSGRTGGEPLFLVLFVDQGSTLSREEALGSLHATQDTSAHQLEGELRDTRERLQAQVEEYETALEELKSSNEELVSVNEELQSTNEELEASKEELQSVNEELHTVNIDLNGKVEALDQANSDLRNLFESTDIATLFLDRDLVIRSFTPAVLRIFNILPGDRGRPLTDLSSRFSLPDFNQDLAIVLAGGEPVERRVDQPDRNAHYLLRLAPYRDRGGMIEGVVVTFIDITSLTRAETRQGVLIAELQHRTRNLLAVVQAIATQTLGRGGSLDAFLTRLAALGRVQGLISHAATDAVDLTEIVHLELRAHAAAENGQITVSGPPIALNFERVQCLALALHELATNAVKYGALKEKSGRIEVLWTVEQDAMEARRLVLLWREHGVVMPEGAPGRGYGRELIEQALAFTLRARTELTFGADGVTCRIELPLTQKVGNPRSHP